MEEVQGQIDMLAQTPTIIIEHQVKNFVARVLKTSEEHKALILEKSSFYGNVGLLKFLLFKSREVWSEEALKTAFENTIMVDNVKAVQLVLDKCEALNINVVTEDMKRLALKRGKTKILKLLEIDYDEVAPTLQIPKHEEFPYVNVRRDIVKTVKNGRKIDEQTTFVTFQQLLDDLLLKDVHYQQDCPKKCKQKKTCQRTRDIFTLLNFVLGEISKRFSIFKDVIIQMIGSLKERTRIGAIDECDLYLMLSEHLQEIFKKALEFDRQNQKILIRKGYFDERGQWTRIDLPEELHPFLSQEKIPEEYKDLYFGFFDTPKYFMTFIKEFYNVVRENPEIPGITGLRMKTDFVPCQVCKNTENVVTTFIRCRHKPDCEEHKQKEENPNYQEKCQCREFTSPAISYSKIGISDL